MSDIKAVRIATVQIAVLADSESACADTLSELLRDAMDAGAIHDWQYLKLGGQFLYGTERHVDLEMYEEGEAFV